MTTIKNLSKKKLLSWIMTKEFTQGNNLQETQLEISLHKGILKAEFICRNGGMILSCRHLIIECPKRFVHLFEGNSTIEFDV